MRWLENVSLHGGACFDPGLPIARLPASSVSSADFRWGRGSRLPCRLPPVVWPSENVGGSGVSWVEHAIAGAVGESARPVDFDHDGDVDVIHASRADDRVSWLEKHRPRRVGLERALDLDRPRRSRLRGGRRPAPGWTHGRGVRVVPRRHGHLASRGVQRLLGRRPSPRLPTERDAWPPRTWIRTATSTWWRHPPATARWPGTRTTFPGPVPWPRRTVTTAAAGAAFVAVADVDRDGDPDLLGASVLDDRVSWYENTAGNGTVWQERTITTAADGATSVASADLDRDGDLDVLSSSAGDGTVAWYENVGGAGAARTRRTITAQAPGAASVTAADLDRDGLPDVMAGSSAGVVWYPNRGGQFALAAMDQAPGTALNGSLVAMLRVDATQPGPAGRWRPRVGAARPAAGVGQRTADAGPGQRRHRVAPASTATQTATASSTRWRTRSCTARGSSCPRRRLTLPFADGDPNGQVTTGATRTYFVVAELTTDAKRARPAAVPGSCTSGSAPMPALPRTGTMTFPCGPRACRRLVGPGDDRRPGRADDLCRRMRPG